MRLLLVEDSIRLQDALRTGLQQFGYAVDVAGDGESGLRYARHNAYDLIILDLMLPKLDGLSVLQTLREERNETHVLCLTARDTVEDRVRGLRVGADDYLVKPFAFDELVARVEALVRRSYGHKETELTIGPLVVDTSARTVHVASRAVTVSRREYALLEYLAQRAGAVVTRHEIEDHLYGERNFPMSNAVDRLVCAVRKKIEASGAPRLLHTRRGLGYVLQEATS